MKITNSQMNMNIIYEELPLVNLNAPKVESRRRIAGMNSSEEFMRQDNEDAEKIMSCLDMDKPARMEDKIEADEKYMIDTVPGKSSKPASMGQGNGRKPHYTRLFALDGKMIFQAACCLPLKVIAAALDDETVSGRVLYCTHSENEGGKLVYEFQGTGSKLIIDVQRGDSTRAQRLIFNV